MRIHDGAYGTLLASRLRGDETVDDLCLREPALVVQAHAAYIDAGARAIQSNSFLAHLRSSDRRRRELQHAAIACAREAAGDADVLVVATLGPAGHDPRDFWRDLELMLGEGVASIQCETVHARSIADAFLAAWDEVARGVEGVELRLGCTVSPARGREELRWVAELASDAPQELQLGLNCCEGPDRLRELLEELCELRGSAWVMPSAGVPTIADGGAPEWPLGEPAAWAAAVAELIDGLPIDSVGGCCGTTPASIRAWVDL